jgi:hypothetical protein
MTKEFSLTLNGCLIEVHSNDTEPEFVLRLFMPGFPYDPVCETYVTYSGGLKDGVKSTWSALGIMNDDHTRAFIQGIEQMHRIGHNIVFNHSNGTLVKYLDKLKSQL